MNKEMRESIIACHCSLTPCPPYFYCICTAWKVCQKRFLLNELDMYYLLSKYLSIKKDTFVGRRNLKKSKLIQTKNCNYPNPTTRVRSCALRWLNLLMHLHYIIDAIKKKKSWHLTVTLYLFVFLEVVLAP